MAYPESPRIIECANRGTAQAAHNSRVESGNKRRILIAITGETSTFPTRSTLQATFALAGRTGRIAAEPGTGQGGSDLQHL